MVNITIDGKQIEVPDGTTVLRAAESAGIHIPTLCDHPQLTPFGGCRLCLVEIDGFRTLQPSCTMPANNNMVIRTNTEKIQQARKFILSLIFSERSHFCPYCQVSGGDCELQNAAYEQEMTHWPLSPNWEPYDIDATGTYFVREYNRCIMCRRCVRACSELVGNFTLGVEERGAKSVLIADMGVALADSSCISCGTCVQVCPTGALMDRSSAYLGHVEEMQSKSTICLGCSVGCGINVLTHDNHLVRIDGDWDAPVNNGVLCEIGRYIPVTENRTRVQTPLIRKDGELLSATWGEAIVEIANRLKPLMGKSEDGVAALVSTRLPAEALYHFKQIFVDHFHSSTVTALEEGKTTATPAILADELENPFEGNLENIKEADCVLVIGADLVDNHQVIGFFVKRNLPNGTKLVVIDPNTNPLDKVANCLIKSKKGSDTDILQGLSAAIAKLGLARSSYTSQPGNSLKEASEKTGVDSETFLQAAHLIASASKPAIIYGKGLAAQKSPEALKELIELARLVGAYTDSNPSLLNTRGRANSLAASQYHLDSAFKINGQQAAFVALGDCTSSENVIQRLKEVPFVVAQATYESPLTEAADVVLPVEAWYEQDGHYLNIEGRLQKANKALNSPKDVWANDAVLQTVANHLGIELDDNWKAQLKQRVASVALADEA